MTRKSNIVNIAVPLGTAVLVTHFFAILYNWYETLTWIDVPLHIGGGMFVALALYWFFEEFPQYFDAKKNVFVSAALALGTAALAGVGWEFAEFVYDLTIRSYDPAAPAASVSVSDVLADLLFDIIGGFVVAVSMALRYYRKQT